MIRTISLALLVGATLFGASAARSQQKPEFSKRVIKKLTASELVYVDPEPVAGRINTHVWKRAK